METLEDVLIATVNGTSPLEINYTLTTSNIGKGFARGVKTVFIITGVFHSIFIVFRLSTQATFVGFELWIYTVRKLQMIAKVRELCLTCRSSPSFMQGKYICLRSKLSFKVSIVTEKAVTQSNQLLLTRTANSIINKEHWNYCTQWKVRWSRSVLRYQLCRLKWCLYQLRQGG